MDPTHAKQQTLDEIIAMMDQATVSKLPKKGAMPPEEMPVDPAMAAEMPMDEAAPPMPGDEMGAMGGEEELSEEDLQALMAMLGEDSEEAY